MTRIFISIASYRDPETRATLRDLFAKAAHPERIFAGVLWQAAPGEDDECMVLPDGIPVDNVRGIQVHPRESLARRSRGFRMISKSHYLSSYQTPRPRPC